MKLAKYINEIYQTFGFLFRLIRKENLKDYIGAHGPVNMIESRKLIVLANGPSLKEELPSFKEGLDYCVVNDLANSPFFEKLKPKYYVLSDPLFFIDTIYKERGNLVYQYLNEKVHWKMNLYVPFMYFKITDWASKIKNTHITVIPFHSVHYAGFENIRFKIYKRGLGNGEFGTVALNAIYIGLLLQYKNITLYGMDHNFFDNLCLDDENRLCSRQIHFYSVGEEVVLKPLINHYHGLKEYYTVHEYLLEKSAIFLGHTIMRKFSDIMGAEIINCTKNSLIDAYIKNQNND